jgi:hypothetical protein
MELNPILNQVQKFLNLKKILKLKLKGLEIEIIKFKEPPNKFYNVKIKTKGSLKKTNTT